MRHFSPKQWTVALSIMTSLLVSLACATLTADPQVDSQESQASNEFIVPADVVFGPGAFNFSDTKAGLANLSSYKATLTLIFDGSETAQPQQWSKTYVMLAMKEPAAQQLTIEKIGADSEIVLIAEVDGAAYERRGKNTCTATVIEEGNSRIEQLEPAGFLNSVIGAEEAGNETVNDVATNHYIFDERAFGQSDLAQSTGEMWVASDGGYIVKYLLTTKGDEVYFGEGIEGTLTWVYELTDINQSFPINPPDDCPAGMVNAPLLGDASDVLNMPGLLTYDTSTSLADSVLFYQKEIPNMGWEPVSEPTITDTTAFLDFTQGNQTMAIIIAAGNHGTTINIVLGKAQE